MSTVEPTQPGRKIDPGQRLDGPHRDLSAQHSADCGDGFTRRVDIHQHALGRGQQRSTGRGQCDPTGGALEQRCLELALELAHRDAERGLRNVHLAGGPGEAQVLGYGGEVFQLA